MEDNNIKSAAEIAEENKNKSEQEKKAEEARRREYMKRVQAQAEEIRVYEEKIHHLADQMIRIDLDDGIKRNYETFKDVLAKIK